MTVKGSEIYLKAAEARATTDVMSGDYGCCDYINKFAPTRKEARAFEALFKPTGIATLYWGDYWSDDFDLKELRDCRVLALLFMHHIARSEES